jgi:3-hydroxyisobutyrate dehydrogenase-like beta-hydroxyacid dehydrogenase
MNVAWFGLGEAGSIISTDLAAQDLSIKAYDPAEVPTPTGIIRVVDPREAVADAELVVAITSGVDALTAINQALTNIRPEAIYADFSTNTPAAKQDMATLATTSGFQFVDIALMSTVPGKGIRTPALASGNGARDLVQILTSYGMPIEYVGAEPGESAKKKLLRSIMMKGLAATIIEALRAADKAGCKDWLWHNLIQEIESADEYLLKRLVTGTQKHATRRLHEMEACEQMLRDLGIEPLLTQGTVENLRRIPDEGIPEIPGLKED